MVSLTELREGQVIKMNNWHGVILAVHFTPDGELALLHVQTVRNIFRGFGPEFVDLRLNPEAITTAVWSDLEHEITQHQRLQESALRRLHEQAAPEERYEPA